MLDELVAQIDDVGQLSLGFAHVLDGDVQPDIGGFQLLNVLLGFHGLVHAVLAQGREHLAGDPVLESLGLWHLAAQDQAVQAALIDDEHLLLAGGGLRFGDTLVLRINVLSDCVGRFGVPQRHGNVLADEPRCAIDLDGAYLPELGISEGG